MFHDVKELETAYTKPNVTCQRVVVGDRIKCKLLWIIVVVLWIWVNGRALMCGMLVCSYGISCTNVVIILRVQGVVNWIALLLWVRENVRYRWIRACFRCMSPTAEPYWCTLLLNFSHNFFHTCQVVLTYTSRGVLSLVLFSSCTYTLLSLFSQELF